MFNSETAWQVSIDYDQLPEAIGSKEKLIRGRGARSIIRASGYLHQITCKTRDEALDLADEIKVASGVSMRIDEVVIFSL